MMSTRVTMGFYPRTLSEYQIKFRLYDAFLAHLQLDTLDSVDFVKLFIEFFAQ